ncbi:hypothetical protein [Caulobacter segnis]
MPEVANQLRHLIFGARQHDPAYWRAHGMVEESEAHFDGPFGWVGLTLKAGTLVGAERIQAEHTNPEATRDAPDLHFWGEGDCPLDVFETAPNVGKLRACIEPPVDGDDRTCWSVGVWLRREA